METHTNATPSASGRLLDVTAVAEWLGFTEHAIRHMVADGTIPVTRIGRSVRFDVVEIEKWLKRSTKAAA